jgi:hypothetical protein
VFSRVTGRADANPEARDRRVTLLSQHPTAQRTTNVGVDVDQTYGHEVMSPSTRFVNEATEW